MRWLMSKRFMVWWGQKTILDYALIVLIKTALLRYSEDFALILPTLKVFVICGTIVACVQILPLQITKNKSLLFYSCKSYVIEK